MAVIAFGLANAFAEPVVADLLADVFRDLFVAVQAKPALRGFLEGFVTTLTVVFVLDVSFDDRTWHDESFHSGRGQTCL